MKDIRIHFDKHNLFEVALVAGVLFALWHIRDFILVLAVALLLSTFIEDFVQIAKKRRIPRMVSVIVFYLLAVIVLVAALVFLFPILATEVSSLAQVYPEVQTFLDNTPLIQGNFENLNLPAVIEQLKDQEVRQQIFNQLVGFFGGLLNVLIVFVISFYLSTQEKGIDAFLRILTPLKYENQVIEIWHRVQKKIGSWFRGQLIIALILAVLTYIGLVLIGLPYAFLLAVLAGIFGLVPYGIILALLPAVAIALTDGGLLTGVIVIGFYFLLQQVLDLGLQPLIVRRMTGIPSILVIISVIIGAKLFGVYGLLLAVPIALFAMEIVAESEKLKSNDRKPLIHQEPVPANIHEDVTIIINNK